jgi:antitoxin component HigA of HigAB toxin-antitoxin module
MDFPISKTIAIKDAGYDESWLQDMIWDNPSILGLGDLETVAKEQVVSSGGKLDILLKDPLDDTMYEVEVSLGPTDPHHIIRTIEYWDLVRKKWPKRSHIAVLIAEKITKRYFNVINLLSNNVPLVAIQANIIQINDERSLHFTNILDAYEEPEDSTSQLSGNYDRDYWKYRSEKTLKVVEYIHELTSNIYDNPTVGFNKSYITVTSSTYNQLSVRQRAGDSVLIQFRFGNKQDEIREILDQYELQYNEKDKHFTMQLNANRILDGEYNETLKKIAELNNRWWMGE